MCAAPRGTRLSALVVEPQAARPILLDVTRALALLALALAAPPAGAPTEQPSVRARPSGAADAATLTDADVLQLVRVWEEFDRAIATLHHDPPPALPAPGTAARAPLSAAEAAWAADDRVRRALASAGTTAAEFLENYREVALAWWALVEAETRAEVAAATREEIRQLRESGDPGARRTADELERALTRLGEQAADAPDLEVVRRHREALERIFSPAAPPPP